MKDRVVFVDRDGVINVDLFNNYVKTWEEFKFHDTVIEGLKQLSDAGFKIIVISNQAGVGDGVFTEKALWQVHKKMLEVLKKKGVKIYASYYCLHGKKAGCECRKPKPGLFQKAAQNGLTFDKSRTYFIGDKVTDMEAGKNFGLHTILVRTGYGPDDEASCRGKLEPDAVVDNFGQAAERVCAS